VHVSNYGLFVAASLALLLTPGPAVLYVVARAVDQGRRAGLISTLGLHVGTLAHLAAAIAGVSALLVSSALAFSLLRWAGAVYLVFLGVRTLAGRGNGERALDAAATPEARQPLARIFSQGIVVNILNPKTALFFLAFLPQFVDLGKGAAGTQIMVLGFTFMALGLVTDGLYALLAGTAAGWLKNSRRFARGQRYVAGTVYIGLGVTTAFSGVKR
jgi:threonine/homoserine/homoserine lactone efflux protein